MEERRKNRRLELEGELIIKGLGGATEAVDINILDASTNGMGFKTSKQLTIGDIYEANLMIWNKERLNVFIQIVRASADEDGYHYGGVFIGMPEDVKMRIQVYETVEEEIAKQEEEALSESEI
ncbi:MAG: PilZ domain-containing protein [Butyrivibrio sp.]|nr:PilZ domain-containing protein [Butyrivibrio sp.]